MRIALAGNPNCGKTTVFNRLTGSSQMVGNWPGVTVERKTGWCALGKIRAEIVDLPGVYSLAPYSPEERIAEAYLKSGQADFILNIVDAANPVRNLYLTSQLLQLGVPVIVVLNRMDAAEHKGYAYRTERLSQALGVPVVAVTAAKGVGFEELRRVCGQGAAAGLQSLAPRLDKDPGLDPEAAEADSRYRWAERVVAQACRRAPAKGCETTLKLDRVLTHRFWGIPLFFAILFLIFYLTFGPLGSLLESAQLLPALCQNADALLTGLGVSQWVRSLLVDGVLSGVGSVASFLPRILLLFALLSLLEDSGYMARVAFLMDAPMRRLGLSGRAFVPLLMGFGCTVPAVLGTRILEKEKDRRLTALILPFFSCSAKMPVYTLFATAFFPNAAAAVILGLYLFGVIMALLLALLFKNTVLSGEPEPFIMELPDYTVPGLRNLWLHVWQRLKDFLIKAGTMLLLASITLWLLQSLTPALAPAADASQSILAALGHWLAPVFSLCGFGSWQAAVALSAGLLAKENVVGALAILYPAGIAGAFTPAAAISFLIFVLLYPPCAGAMSVMRREMGKRRWMLLTVFYQLAAAWYCSAMFYQCASLISRYFFHQ